jgi:hypothetical protein
MCFALPFIQREVRDDHTLLPTYWSTRHLPHPGLGPSRAPPIVFDSGYLLEVLHANDLAATRCTHVAENILTAEEVSSERHRKSCRD